MKKIFSNKRLYTIGLLVSWLVGSLGFISCKNEEDVAGTPITVSSVYLEDAKSTVQDREVTFARLGAIIRISGTGFTGVKKVYVNGYSTYFNPVMVTDNSMLIQISGKTPVTEADSKIRNTIRFVKDATEFTYTLQIREAAPTIISVSNTLPAAGDTITIYGTGLVEISKITFPGNIVTTDNIISDTKGNFCKVLIPNGLTESGSILVEGTNGGAYSPSYFNCKSGLILNFDGIGTQGYWSWSATGGMLNNTDLESTTVGLETKSQGNYCAHRPSRLASFPASKNRNTEVWTAGNNVDNWRGSYTSLIPATTAVSNFAFQFDMYVPETWAGSGFLKICLYNSFNGGEWTGNCYNYIPWLVNNAISPVKTTGWVTVTIPFNKFYAFSDKDVAYTFENVLAAREKASWQNFGIYFENSDIKLSNVTGNKSDESTVFASSATTVKVYTDNWRIVPLSTPVYSDYPATAN